MVVYILSGLMPYLVSSLALDKIILGGQKNPGRPKPNQAPLRPTDFGPALTHEGLDKDPRKKFGPGLSPIF